MRGLVVAVLALAACGTGSMARDGAADGRAETGVHLQFDGVLIRLRQVSLPGHSACQDRLGTLKKGAWSDAA